LVRYIVLEIFYPEGSFAGTRKGYKVKVSGEHIGLTEVFNKVRCHHFPIKKENRPMQHLRLV
jgi:hypothetical protein